MSALSRAASVLLHDGFIPPAVERACHGAIRPGEQEHVVRRLESFSDIVIALTLSSLAINLQLPNSIEAAVANPSRYIAFLRSFAIVCGIWWLHNRLFANFFVASILSVVLNFVLLGVVVMLGVALQMFLRFSDATPAAIAYAACVAAVFGLFCILFTKGVAEKRATLTPDIRGEGISRARRCGLVSGVMLVSHYASTRHSRGRTDVVGARSSARDQ